MNVASLQNNPAADLPIEQLAHNRTLTEQQKVGEVSRQFEALLLRQILQETQKTVIPSKYADNSTTASIYHDMVANQLADSISKSGTVGLAQSLERQLTRQLQPASTTGPDRSAVTKSHLPPETDTARPTLLHKSAPWQATNVKNSAEPRARNQAIRHLSPVTAFSAKPNAPSLPQP
jgi:Rod binding domain-containing protein